MAGHLMAKGHSLMVYNRTASKADELVAAGAQFMEPTEIARNADCLFMMLGYPHDVREMAIGASQGIVNIMKPGSTLIDHTTSSPSLAEEIAAVAVGRGVHSVDAPVSGGDIGAKNGNLVTMVGGSQEGVGSVKDLLDVYSVEVQHMGEAGAG